jgi:tRNA (guanine-N7-)-methyltransferase
MGKIKGPDMMEMEAATLVESAWLPSRRILEAYDWEEVFGRVAPVELELGSGDGSFILELARRHPEVNYLAVERLMGRARKIVKRTQAGKLRNIKTWRLDSSYVVAHLCPAQSIQRVWILFPDPWPKARHHRRRLIQPEFLESLRRILEPGGEVRFATDHEDYFQWARDLWEANPDWAPGNPWDGRGDPTTDFQREFEREGRAVHRACWRLIPLESR